MHSRAWTWDSPFFGVEGGGARVSWVHSFLVNLKWKIEMQEGRGGVTQQSVTYCNGFLAGASREGLPGSVPELEPHAEGLRPGAEASAVRGAPPGGARPHRGSGHRFRVPVTGVGIFCLVNEFCFCFRDSSSCRPHCWLTVICAVFL